MKSNQVAKPLNYPNMPEVPNHILNKASLGKFINDIRSRLTLKDENPSKKQERYLRKMKRRCFKDLFIGLKRINFSVGIVHHLIGRRSQSSDNTCMKFNFGGKASKFTKRSLI